MLALRVTISRINLETAIPKRARQFDLSVIYHPPIKKPDFSILQALKLTSPFLEHLELDLKIVF